MAKYKHFGKSPDIHLINKTIANRMLAEWHYLGPVRGIILALGHSEGVLVFTNLRSRNLEKYLRENDIIPVELARMVAKPGHRWAMSSLMSKCIKYIKENTDYDIIVTYADPFAGHNGAVYKANNWIHYGYSSRDGHPLILIDGKSISPRSLYDKHGTSSISVLEEIYGSRLEVRAKPAKKRFVFPLNEKAHQFISSTTSQHKN